MRINTWQTRNVVVVLVLIGMSFFFVCNAGAKEVKDHRIEVKIGKTISVAKSEVGVTRGMMSMARGVRRYDLPRNPKRFIHEQRPWQQLGRGSRPLAQSAAEPGDQWLGCLTTRTSFLDPPESWQRERNVWSIAVRLVLG